MGDSGKSYRAVHNRSPLADTAATTTRIPVVCVAVVTRGSMDRKNTAPSSSMTVVEGYALEGVAD
jgi:hypothetical protein